MNRNNKVYQEQLIHAINMNDFKKIYNRKIMITGATGLIGSCIIDVLMKENEINQANIDIYAMVRNIENAKNTFKEYANKKLLKFIEYDVIDNLNADISVDYIIHAASNAHPLAYSIHPINTMLGNIEGIKNILDYGVKNNTKRVLFVSSGEIYGEGSERIEAFDEEYRGYIDNLLPRSCYPISKIAAETLCSCYSKEHELETVIVRPCHVYGPTMTEKDSRAIAQFIRNAVNNQDIIMKSEGKQYRSYCYVLDCATAVIIALINGENRNAYNISNKDSNITIKDMAELIAKYTGKKVIYDLPDDIEKEGYNVVKRSILDDTKIKKLGWKPTFDMEKGIEATIKILT